MQMKILKRAFQGLLLFYIVSGMLIPCYAAVNMTGPEVPAEGYEEILDTEGLAADTLTITVGYYGGTYYTKKVFTLEELESMELVRQTYSYVDNMPAVCIDSAVGVRLSDLIEAAGIDLASVRNFDFYCSDISTSWFISMTKTFLLDTPRYYYPNLAVCWDYDEAEPLSGAAEGAVRVDTILALQDKWRRMATETNFENLTDTTRFRLLFGQTDTTSQNGSWSAKWVHTIAVTLAGSPPKGITMEQADLSMEVGSHYRLSATVEQSDETTDTRVKWSSSDESIARVDSYGRVTVVGEGTALITAASYDGTVTASIGVTGTGTDSEPKEEDEDIPPPEIEDEDAPPLQITQEVSPENLTSVRQAPEPSDSIAEEPPEPVPESVPEQTAQTYHLLLSGGSPAPEEEEAQPAQPADGANAVTPLADLAVDGSTQMLAMCVGVLLLAGGVLEKIIRYRREI